jgi:two-component system, chemotaxis family, chemotaxis protein CheY
MRALVVDDSKITRRLVSQLLAESGFHDVVQAGDGVEALRLLGESERFDLLVTDWRMPRLDGLGLLEAVQRDPGLRGVPVVVISSMSDDEAVARLFAAGARHFVRKPFEPSAVRRTLAEVARVERMRAADRPALSGSLRGTSVVELVQWLSLTNRTGALHIDSDGRIDVAAGQVVGARAGGAAGEAAFLLLAERRDGAFRFDPDASPQPRSVERPTSALLFEALRRCDERARAVGSPCSERAS